MLIYYKAVPQHTYGGAGGRENVQLLLIHDLGTRWGWVVSVTPRPRFTRGERTPSTHCAEGWVGPRAGLDIEFIGKILLSLTVIEPRSPGRPARSQALYWLSYPAYSQQEQNLTNEVNNEATCLVADTDRIFKQHLE
jgi:hypothetical protein